MLKRSVFFTTEVYRTGMSCRCELPEMKLRMWYRSDLLPVILGLECEEESGPGMG